MDDSQAGLVSLEARSAVVARHVSHGFKRDSQSSRPCALADRGHPGSEPDLIPSSCSSGDPGGNYRRDP